MPDENFLKNQRDTDQWIVPSSNCNTLYAEKINTLEKFKSVKGERLFDDQGGFPNGCLEQHIDEYGTFY